MVASVTYSLQVLRRGVLLDWPTAWGGSCSPEGNLFLPVVCEDFYEAEETQSMFSHWQMMPLWLLFINTLIDWFTWSLTTRECPSALPWHWAMPSHRAPPWAASVGELTTLSSGAKSCWGVRGGMMHPWNGTSSAEDRLLSSVAGESNRGKEPATEATWWLWW